jgi:hypothetical protein
MKRAQTSGWSGSRLRAAALVWLVGCTADPIVGAWTADDKMVLEFHGNGSITGYTKPLPDELACTDRDANQSPEAAACARAHHWKRSGDTYELTFMCFAARSKAGLSTCPVPPVRARSS